MDTIIHLYFIRNHINDLLQDLFNHLYTISIKTMKIFNLSKFVFLSSLLQLLFQHDLKTLSRDSHPSSKIIRLNNYHQSMTV